MKHILVSILFCCMILAENIAYAQPNYNFDVLKREKLDRGFVAIRENEKTVNLTWRYFSSDPLDIMFDIYIKMERKSTPIPSEMLHFLKIKIHLIKKRFTNCVS